jgi:hypothetical protein
MNTYKSQELVLPNLSSEFEPHRLGLNFGTKNRTEWKVQRHEKTTLEDFVTKGRTFFKDHFQFLNILQQSFLNIQREYNVSFFSVFSLNLHSMGL